MKKIFISAALILSAAGALAASSTGAFFSDTETSAGNVFTAGSIDLKIDHSFSTYNGNSVEQDLVIVSDPQTQVDGHDAAIISDTPITTQYWTASSSIPGAAWIWSENPAGPAVNTLEQKTFTRTFNWNGPVTNATLLIAADNRYKVTLNGFDVDLGAGFASNDQHAAADTYNVSVDIVQGVNTLVVLGQNDAQANPPDQSQNPAGVKFRLTIAGQQLNPDPIDLSGQPFWTFDDVKPADKGIDVFSLHVDTNDAWSCMLVGNIKNEENDRIEPETSAGDTTDGPGNGELGQFLHLFMWRDTDGDGLFEPGAGELALTPLAGFNLSGASATTSIPVNDSTIGGILPGGTSEDVGSAWCAGTMSVDGGTGVITCDGNTPNINQSQTDSTTADLTFYATQSRNQPNFTCSSLVAQ